MLNCSKSCLQWVCFIRLHKKCKLQFALVWCAWIWRIKHSLSYSLDHDRSTCAHQCLHFAMHTHKTHAILLCLMILIMITVYAVLWKGFFKQRRRIITLINFKVRIYRDIMMYLFSCWKVYDLGDKCFTCLHIFV